MNLDHKKILVVGGSKGIGFRTIELLTESNAEIYNISRSANESFDALNVNHHELDIITEDFSSLDSFLPDILDGVVYCPGTITLKPFPGLKPEDFKNDLEVNYIGAVKILKKALPKLRKNKSGSIVLFSTVASRVGMSYHASIAGAKAAVEGLGKSLAAELASANIRVNIVAPSLTDTSLAENLLNSEAKQKASIDRHPIKRFGTVDDQAEMVVYLLSDKARWVTGQVISIDGGLSSLKPL